jgi:uncharacterized membrane protein YcaP (DUF421 family)
MGGALMDVILRSAIAFLFIWGLFRAMGRRELSQLSAFELVLLMVVGDLIQQGITGEDSSLIGGLSAAATMGLLALLFSWASFRFKGLRRLIEGDAIVVVKDGKINHKRLERQRFSLDDLKAEARLSGIENLDDVRAAILEPDGRVSFLSDHRNETDKQKNPIT